MKKILLFILASMSFTLSLVAACPNGQVTCNYMDINSLLQSIPLNQSVPTCWSDPHYFYGCWPCNMSDINTKCKNMVSAQRAYDSYQGGTVQAKSTLITWETDFDANGTIIHTT